MPSESLNSQYVRNFFNRRAEELSEDYTFHRWFSSPAAVADYRQTERTILRVLEKKLGEVLEIGPGGGIWTKFLAIRARTVHCIDQSEKMLHQAQRHLVDCSNVTYECSDFLESQISRTYEYIVSIRAFEYFEDKERAIRKMSSFLTPGGCLLLVTKNPRSIGFALREDPPLLHSGRMDCKEIVSLLQQNGFMLEAVYPAVLKWKAEFVLSRILFDFLHRLTLRLGGVHWFPFMTYCVESYLFKARKIGQYTV